MPKIKAVPSVETTVATTTQVNLDVKSKQMLDARLKERAEITVWEKEKIGTKDNPGRRRRIDDEIQDIFRAAKQGKALVNGVSVDGTSLVLVVGTSKKFDQIGFMKKHGLTQADFDEFTSSSENDPYLKVTPPRGRVK